VCFALHFIQIGGNRASPNANVLPLPIRGHCQKYWILQWNEQSVNVAAMAI
jgi:hypothetical protein